MGNESCGWDYHDCQLGRSVFWASFDYRGNRFGNTNLVLTFLRFLTQGQISGSPHTQPGTGLVTLFKCRTGYGTSVRVTNGVRVTSPTTVGTPLVLLRFFGGLADTRFEYSKGYPYQRCNVRRIGHIVVEAGLAFSNKPRVRSLERVLGLRMFFRVGNTGLQSLTWIVASRIGRRIILDRFLFVNLRLFDRNLVLD